MFIPVRCLICYAPVGNVGEIFRRERQEFRDENPSLQASLLSPEEKDRVSEKMVKLYESLGINSDCCRTALDRAMDFRDYQ